MKAILPLTLGLSALLLTACSSSAYFDGKYEARSFKDSHGAYAQVSLVLDNDDIVQVDYVTVMADGKIKDERYGQGLDKEMYEAAQVAVKAMPIYKQTLIETQDIDEVDAISGATTSNKQFKDAVKKALRKAQR